MAFAFTVTDIGTAGPMRRVTGTFTSATGDTTATLDADVHGLNYIVDRNIDLQGGGVNIPRPKIEISGGTVTVTWDDTLGYSGFWSVTGR